MRVAVLGATGMVGCEVVAEAYARGHAVIAISRTARPDSVVDRLTFRAIDVTDADVLDEALAEVDVAVLSVRLAPGSEDQLAEVTRGLLDAASRNDVRVLVVGGATPLRTPNNPHEFLIDAPSFVPPAWRTIAQASVDQLRACKEHSYDGWTYLSPPAVLEPGVRTGRYQRGSTTLLTDKNGDSRISAADLAIAVVEELEEPGNVQHFTVARDPSPH